MSKTERRIEELEKKVRELESRPQILIIPAQPAFPPLPINPWPGYQPYTPIITC